MIDWRGVLSNSAWIVGLAMALAAFSYAEWRAASRGEDLRAALARRQFRILLSAGMALISLGLAFAGHRPWAKSLAGMLAAGFVFEAGRLCLARGRDSQQ